MNNPIRWMQRFQNLDKAYQVFMRRMDEYTQYPDAEAYQMSLIQAFEIVFELAWKTMKDYLENDGYDEVQNAKKTIRVAFAADLIGDAAETWMQAIEQRNQTSHVYNPEVMLDTLAFISRDFAPVMRDLYFTLKKQVTNA
jgi:nucleotidyltransferase substrate binding protein (TIGR01987 family)